MRDYSHAQSPTLSYPCMSKRNTLGSRETSIGQEPKSHFIEARILTSGKAFPLFFLAFVSIFPR